jgi:hypothetical protein
MKFPTWSIEWLLPLLRNAFVITLLLGIIVHFISQDMVSALFWVILGSTAEPLPGVIVNFISQDWVSGLLWIFTGATASAWLTIYTIETELFRKHCPSGVKASQ